jgi:hypothetical protein
MELKEFFYTSYKFISDCLVYLRTNTVDAAWKADNYAKFKGQQIKIERLFNLYSDIDQKMGLYFKPTYCLTRLSECFLTTGAEAASITQSTTSGNQELGKSGYRVR